MTGYMLRYAVVGGVFGPQIYHRASYRLKCKYHFLVKISTCGCIYIPPNILSNLLLSSNIVKRKSFATVLHLFFFSMVHVRIF